MCFINDISYSLTLPNNHSSHKYSFDLKTAKHSFGGCGLGGKEEEAD